jgi:CheY-specific phosphatase CheX
VSPVPDRARTIGFLRSVVEVLGAFGISAEICEGATELATTGPIDMHAIGVLICVSGDLTGLTWQFPIAVTRRAASVLAPGLALEPEILEAAASELANVLTGRGLDALACHGIDFEIAPPRITSIAMSGDIRQVTTDLGLIVVSFHRGVLAP